MKENPLPRKPNTHATLTARLAHTHISPRKQAYALLPPPTLFFCRLLTHIAAHLFSVNKKIKELQATAHKPQKKPDTQEEAK